MIGLGLTITLSTSAAPHKPSTHDTKAQQDLFEQSARAYREGRFQEAVDKLVELHRQKPEPVLLYNLARAYEALGRWTEAADAYEKYLNDEPGAADRRAIEGKIATLRAQAAELAAARKPDREPPQTPDPPRLSQNPKRDAADPVPSAVPWIIAGAGVAIIGTGFALGVAADGEHEDAVAEPTQVRAVDKQDSAESLAQASTITVIAGAIIALAGVSWIVVRSTSAPSTPTTAKWPSPLRWTFP